MTVPIVAGAAVYLLVLIFALSLCRAAARGDQAIRDRDRDGER